MKKSEIEPFYDNNGNILDGSVAEKIFVDVNGYQNGMIIRGKNVDNPVILFISGGPGVPEYWLNEYYENKLEDEYTVCWWDYYGEGLSYEKGIDPAGLTLERLEKDAVTVSEYLKERFGKDKIILMGHSAGTILAIRLAMDHPELYSCYFAMGQAVEHGYDRYSAGYQFMKKIFEDKGDTKSLKKMNKLVEVDENNNVVAFKKEPIAKYWEGILLRAGCATTREMRSDATGIFIPQMRAKCYTGKEKINYWLGKILYSKSDFMKNTTVEYDEDYTFEIPVYFFSGFYDYTSPQPLAASLYYKVEAPKKEHIALTKSAHSPLWEENENFLRLMRERLENE